MLRRSVFMLLEKLENVLESIILVSGSAVAISDIAAKLELQESELNKAIANLKAKYSGESGIRLVKFNKKLQFSSNPDYEPFVEKVLKPEREKALSRACLEIAAIIAYKQPITRLEIEGIRGVNGDHAMHTLAKNNLIQVVGQKDAIGKPYQYGTSEEFLRRFQLESIENLPDLESLLERLAQIGPPKDTALFNRFELKEENNDNNDDDEGDAQFMELEGAGEYSGE
jgi:segregation and condensation protein B